MAVEKVSVSLDTEVLAETRERLGGRGLSAYLNPGDEAASKTA